MLRISVIIMICAWSAGLHAQYTYFNQLTGIQGDLESEGCANVEVVSDGYVVWGGGINDGSIFYFVRKYDFDGTILDANIIEFTQEYFYTGVTISFQWDPNTERFIVIHSAETLGDVKGRLLAFNSSLDLEIDLYYDLYPPNTYFFGFLIEPDGYVVIGEQGPNINSEGTFIAKLDFEGNVLWNEILQPEVFQHIYRNSTIISIDGGYLIGGYGITSEVFGILTKTDLTGNTTDVIISTDISVPRSYGIFASKLSNGEILTGQGFGYEWVSEIGNPYLYWAKTRLRKFNSVTNEFYGPVVEYFDNYEFYMGGALKCLPTSDGGAIFVGSNPGYSSGRVSWLQKVDSNGNEEWFKPLNYDNCNNCENLLYDIELAPDGGYIAAGYFINWDVDPRSSTWLVKVDACGDLEWQGCSPLNVPERKGQSFSIYPNPSTGRFTVETANQSRAQSYRVYDLSGRLVAQEMLSAAESAFTIDVNIPSGFYTLHLTTDGGEM
jgi:hypothetical protein